MYLGYNTNGLVHHRLADTVDLLAEIGYQGVAVTIDHGDALDPLAPDRLKAIEQLQGQLEKHRMHSVVETGARYVLDPWNKHEPSLVSPDPEARARRLAFYEYAIDVAATLGSDCVSFWSGKRHKATDPKLAWQWLVEGITAMAEYADQRGVMLGMETEPGMFVDMMADFEQLLGLCDAPRLRLTMDVGHLLLQGDTPLAHMVHLWSSRLVNVHMEDMKAAEHRHLMFGEGEIDFPALIQSFREVDYQGGLYVELSGDSDTAPQTAKQAFEFLQPLVEGK